MPLSYTEHFRFGIPDFLSEPWHADWEALVRHIDRALYQSIILDGAIPWVNSYAFGIGDIAIDPTDGRLWISRVAHTSAVSPTTFPADRANNPTFWDLFASAPPINIEFVIDGSGGVIIPGTKGDLQISFNAEITKVTLLADQSGNIVVDIWKDNYGSYPPVVGDSITGTAKPTLLGTAKSQDITLANWNRTINAGDTLRFNVDSVSLIQRVTVSLECLRT